MASAADRPAGQPLHARCHRNLLSLKHRLIITDAGVSRRHLYTPVARVRLPLTLHRFCLLSRFPPALAYIALPSLPPSLSRSRSLYSLLPPWRFHSPSLTVPLSRTPSLYLLPPHGYEASLRLPLVYTNSV